MKKNVHILVMLCIALVGNLNAQIDFISHTNPTGDKCFNVNKSADGKIYVGSEQGQVFVYDGMDWSTIVVPGSFSDDDVQDVAVAPDGTIWIAMKNKGVVKYDGADFTFYNESNSGIGENDINNIAVTDAGIVYATSVYYLNIFEGEWSSIPAEENELLDIYLGDIEVDGDKIWIANGFGLLSYENGTFSRYILDQFDGDIELNDSAIDIQRTANGSVLISHSDGVAQFSDKKGSAIVSFDEGNCNSLVAVSPSEFWTFTRLQHALYYFKDGNVTKYEVGNFDFVESFDSYMAEGNNGDIWIVNKNGNIYQLLSVISQVDNDQDGYTEGEDCDDNDASLSPGAYDIANNGIDEDCSGSDLVFISGCWTDLSGIYDLNTVLTNQVSGEGWDYCEGITWAGTMYFEEDTPGSYKVFTRDENNSQYFEDLSFGGYYGCYGTSSQSDLPLGDLRFEPLCDGFIITGASQWGEVFTISNQVVTMETISFNWVNDYGEGALVTFSRQDNCPLALFDADGDGYLEADDCDDTNADIYPGATEIANNGIDEDCDGEDLILDAVIDIASSKYETWPNPVSTTLFINNTETKELAKTINIYDLNGALIKTLTSIKSNTQIQVMDLNQGTYMLEIKESDSKDIIRGLFIKM